jgi:predicted acyltransferase (DUF342 family)
MTGASRTRSPLPLLLLGGFVLLLAASPVLAQESPEGAEGSRYSPWATTVLLTVFVALLFLPFVPGLIEVYKPRDQYPLPVNMEYTKDPRYLGKSAWSIVRKALAEHKDADGLHEITMHKEETVEVSGDRVVPRKSKLETLVYARGDLTLQEGVVAEHDLFVEGAAHVAPGCQIRALACEGDVTLRRECTVTRWLDAVGAVDVGPECSVGVSLSSTRRIRLDTGVKFRRLFGDPIETAGASDAVAAAPAEPYRPRRPEKIETVEDTVVLEAGDHRIDPGREIERPLVVKGDLDVGKDAVLWGSVRVYGKTRIESGAVFHGNVFTEGPVEVGEGVTILGNLFSQDEIRLARGVRIGRSGHAKSVIARMGLHLSPDVRIFGYVVAEGEGTVS